MQSNIWYPFTQMKDAPEPVEVSSARGSVLYTSDGRQIIDAVSSWWVNIHGHCNPIIAAAITEQANTLEHVIFAGFTHRPALELSEQLLSILPPHYKKIFFSDDGSTSVEVAIKMALQYWSNRGAPQKKVIIAFRDAYHGDTFGAMSVGERGSFNRAFHDLLFEVKFLPLPDASNRETVCAMAERYASENSVAAFIFEPLVQGAGGMKMYAADALNDLLCFFHEREILCIADEVMTGFGRTGPHFATANLKQQPDIICLSKGLTGGFLPMGLTVCSQDVFDAFYSDDSQKTFFHGHSYTGNPLACAAAVASIKILKSKQCQENIERICSMHSAFLEELTVSPVVKSARQCGTILAFDLVTSSGDSYFHAIGKDAYRFFLSKDVLLRPLGNTIYIMPPYCISSDELSKVYGVIVDFLKSAEVDASALKV